MKICKVKNCNSKHSANGFCNKHYLQMCRYGNILARTKFDPNEFVDCGDYYEICLYNIKHKEIARAKINRENLEKVRDYKWNLSWWGYVICSSKEIKLHQLILGKKKGFEIDHINGNKLDNLRQNLRYATRSQNEVNKKSKGYSWCSRDKIWSAYITINNKGVNIGSFKTEVEAIKARREAELKYYGEYAYQSN